ncbi:MAG: LPS-assembly protein LptD [Nitrospirae bacterium]|nr:LPS-assembly protein LptD [Nitrospirota bacterium]
MTGRAAIKALVALAFSLFTLHSPLSINLCYAAGQKTVITSDTLEYFSETKKYIARGTVTVEQADATVEADEMVYFAETGDVTASGNVRYSDRQTFFTATAAEMNMEKKTGKLYEADILSKDDNFRIKGREIERRAENEFYSRDEITVTTCDGPVAAWCFRGREMDLVIGDKITGQDVSFRVRDIPLLYSPRLWAPLNNDRKTGFLLPTVGSSSSRGLGLNIPFFWAIAENRDATFLLDAYARQGIGTGMEYRFIEPGVQSIWQLYHIRDHRLHTDFTEFRALHDDRSTGGTGLFLNANFVNEKNYYREIAPQKNFFREIHRNSEQNIQRFLETTVEVTTPFDNARAYFLAQYWIDLKDATGDIPQRLPEIGYVMNYTRLGSFLVSAEAAAVNFWRKNGVSAHRLDLFPAVLHTVGSDVVLSQTAAVRGTAYEFYHDGGSNSNQERLAFEYDGNIHARFVRRYGSFTHMMEPAIRYHYISSSPNDLGYTFDEWELHGKTSRLELSLLNRFLVKGKEVVTARVTQPFDMNNGDRPFRPFEFELAMQMPVPARVTTAYDVNTGKIQAVSSEFVLPFSYGSVSFGQRYSMPDNIMVFRAGLAVQPVRPIQLGLEARYDAKGEGLRQVGGHAQYTSQCWGVRLEAVKKPGDFSVQMMFDLFGITAKQPRDTYQGSGKENTLPLPQSRPSS